MELEFQFFGRFTKEEELDISNFIQENVMYQHCDYETVMQGYCDFNNYKLAINDCEIVVEKLDIIG